MGRASRAKPPAPPIPGRAPNARRVTCDHAEYRELRLLIREVDVLVAECQQRVNAAIAPRDAALRALADKHGIDMTPGTKIQWDDDTMAVTFSSETGES